MTSPTSLLKCAAAIALAPIATQTLAAELSSSVGVGGSWKQKHIKGEHSSTRAFPYINLEYGAFTASPNGLGANLSTTRSDEFSALLKYRRSPIEQPENRVLRSLDERDDATEVALQWLHKMPYVDVTSSAAFDISDTHEGYEAQVKLSKAFETKIGLMIPAASVAYQSDDLVDYYYGVSAREATPSIGAYDADGTLNSQLSVTHIFPLTDHWHTSTKLSYDHLGSEIADSTIVDRSDFWAATVSVFYTF